jgi:hypothetical protein
VSDAAPNTRQGAPDTRHGAGRVLLALYALFALAATSRAAFQLATKYQQAPLAYLLSAFAGVVYIVATVALARSTVASARVATVAIGIEAIGVVAIGALSYARPEDFPDATVWSHFGQGYGFVPLVLPFLGLAFLRRVRR